MTLTNDFLGEKEVKSELRSGEAASNRSLLINKVHKFTFSEIEHVDKTDVQNEPQKVPLCDCGKKTGNLILLETGGYQQVIDTKLRCNSRVCPKCARRKQKRAVREYLPLLKKYALESKKKDKKPEEKGFKLRFLTICPDNYDNLEYGLKDIRKSFNMFLRLKYGEDKNKKSLYMRDMIKGALYVIEEKKVYAGEEYIRFNYQKNEEIKGVHSKTGWNVHIHAVIYSKRLDNVIRGKCYKCNQNYIKFDAVSNIPYCANRKCNSTEVLVYNKDSRLNRIWKKASKRNGFIYITDMDSEAKLLNYMAKFTLADMSKEIMSRSVNNSDKLEFLNKNFKRRLISKIGCFYKAEYEKEPKLNRFTKKPEFYTRDYDMIQQIREVMTDEIAFFLHSKSDYEDACLKFYHLDEVT